MKKIANSKGGKCLSIDYKNNRSKLLWECKDNHKWEATPGSIVNSNTWCPYCSGRKGDFISRANEIAKNRGGRCLSIRWVNSKQKLKWECAQRHTWHAVFSSIQKGTWCSDCSSYIGERICRKAFEQIFQKKFKKARPEWLQIDKRRFELDGYNAGLKLAFEHHGRYHFMVDRFYSSNKLELKKRKVDDKTKENLCKRNSVKLIVIPEINYYLSLPEVIPYIQKQLKRKKIRLPKKIKIQIEDLESAYKFSSGDILNEFHALAKTRGGVCLSKLYLGSSAPLRWRCKEGHKWKATTGNIKRGTWCPICAKNVAWNIELCKKLAQQRGGACVSKRYVNARVIMEWRCKLGHKWKTTQGSIKAGTWCPKCHIINKSFKTSKI